MMGKNTDDQNQNRQDSAAANILKILTDTREPIQVDELALKLNLSKPATLQALVILGTMVQLEIAQQEPLTVRLK